jgi:hypothetical protein
MRAGRRVYHEGTKGTKWRVGLESAGIVLATTTTSIAEETILNPARVEAARARAEQRWHEAQFDQLPINFDRERIAVEMANYSNSIVAYVANTLIEANPGREDDVIEYVNDGLVRFIASHKEAYLCVMTQHYYSFDVPAREIANIREPGETWMLEVDYLLLNTEAQREASDILIPAGWWGAEISHMREQVKRYGWHVTSHEKVSLGCAEQPVS